MKSCLWCKNPCEYFFNVVAPECRQLEDKEQTEMRKRIAEECKKYIPLNEIFNPKVDKESEAKIIEISTCSINIYAQSNPPCLTTLPGTVNCPECGKPMCPVCHRHNVTQLSRVTGYVGNVSGWNEGKKQEFKDRKRYSIDKLLR